MLTFRFRASAIVVTSDVRRDVISPEIVRNIQVLKMTLSLGPIGSVVFIRSLLGLKLQMALPLL